MVEDLNDLRQIIKLLKFTIFRKDVDLIDKVEEFERMIPTIIDNPDSDSFSYIQLEINESQKKENGVNTFFYDRETNSVKIKLSHKYKNIKVVIYISEWKKITLYINDKIIDFAQKVNNIIKKYETFNIVSENGDSIYSPTVEELTTVIAKERCQVFISEYKLEEIVNRIIAQRLGSNY